MPHHERLPRRDLLLHVVVDEALQLAVHGSAILKLEGDRIHRWREYWYESDLPYAEFAGESAFVRTSASVDIGGLMQRLAAAWNESDTERVAALFSEDAVYVEPPDRQRYRGRRELDGDAFVGESRW